MTRMTPLQASEFSPYQSAFVDDAQVTIPDVDCGPGYRQLRWLEEITEGD